MKKITITARNNVGTKALRAHITECKHLDRKALLMWKMMGWKQEITKESPLTLTVQITKAIFGKFIKTDDVLKKIHEALKNNGASYPGDYTIE